ncbi:MAG: DUF3592 domain-containing protein [Lachnospiraceae bacterium]|nr:DUF3592 domain-containing protein [Lachnospiraceae bacterium]
MNGIRKIFICLLGVIFIVVGIALMIHNNKINKTAVDVQATITKMDRNERHVVEDGKTKTEVDYDVYVDYSFEGNEFKDVKLNYYTAGMKEGKEITVKINPDNPAQCYGDTSMLFPLISIGIGLIAFLAGLFVRAR